jgi:hypothetical protein
MHRFASIQLWPLIEQLAAEGGAKHAAIAYVASDAGLAFGEDDVLVTDAGDASIASGTTSAKVLRAAHQRGATLYSLPGLHAKVVCIGMHAVIGSANASASSRQSLIEAAVVTNDPRLFASTRAFVEQLIESADEIDEAFLARISKLEVVRTFSPLTSGNRRKVDLEDRQPRIWLVGIHQIDESKYPHEADIAEEGLNAAEADVAVEGSDVSWLRFTSNSKFRREAQRGDSVIQLYREDPKSKSPSAYLPAPILRRQEESGCTRFYIEEFAELEQRSLSWRRFLQIWGRATDGGEPPSITGVRLLRDDVASMLQILWEKAAPADP